VIPAVPNGAYSSDTSWRLFVAAMFAPPISILDVWLATGNSGFEGPGQDRGQPGTNAEILVATGQRIDTAQAS